VKRVARCCCSACSIEVEGEPVLNAICHCTNCKQRTGSAFGWSSYFPDEQVVRKTGDVSRYDIASANRQERWFCAICGTTLFWKSQFWPGATGIAGGCFVDPPLASPTVTVSNAGRCDWLVIPPEWRTSL
jgi:hypothetical protein